MPIFEGAFTNMATKLPDNFQSVQHGLCNVVEHFTLHDTTVSNQIVRRPWYDLYVRQII